MRCISTPIILSLSLTVGGCGHAEQSDSSARAGASAGAGAGPTASTTTTAPTLPDPAAGSAGEQSPVIMVNPMQQAAGSCKAGHYIGKFFGDYRSAAWFEGAELIMFATADVNSLPGFEFWLESVDQPCLPGQEFCTGAIVKGGKLRGNATPFEDASNPDTMGGLGFSVRFEIDLTGELDCNTGRFRGRLENGCYDILSVLHRFDGDIQGEYSLSANTFTTGMWNVQEMLMPDAPPPATELGGSGQWSADFADDSAAPTGPGMGLCSGQSGFDTPAP
jgi:hypothetical protein